MEQASTAGTKFATISTRLLTLIGNRFVLASTAIFLAITFASLFFFANLLDERKTELISFRINAERILGLDNSITASIRLAAGLKSRRYIQNYRSNRKVQVELLEESRALVKDDKFVNKLEALMDSHQVIRGIEDEAVASVRAKNWDDGLDLVTDKSFKREKGVYRADLSLILRELISVQETNSDRTAIFVLVNQILVLIAFALLAVIGFSFSFQFRENLTRQEELSEELSSSNARLEDRVQKLIQTESSLYSVQEDLDHQMKVFRNLFELGQDFLTTKSSDDAFEKAVQNLNEKLGYDRCGIFYLDPESQTYSLKKHAGFWEESEAELISKVILGSDQFPVRQLVEGTDEEFVLEGNADPEKAGLAASMLVDEAIFLKVQGPSTGLPSSVIMVGNAEENFGFSTRIVEESDSLVSLKSLASMLSSVLSTVVYQTELEEERNLLETRVAERTEDLRRSEAQVISILHESPVAVAIVREKDGSILFSNTAFQNVFGYDNPEQQMTAQDLFVDDDQRNVIIDAYNQEGVVRDIETQMKRSDGLAFWVLLTLIRFDYHGEQTRLAWAYDISERKAAEEKMVEAKELAEDATKAKADFLATMSHEIRTPMNGVMSMAEILDQTKLTSDQRSMTKTIRGSAEALLTIINDILDFSKIEAGKLDVESISFDPIDVVESAADLLAPRAEEGGLDLIVDVDPSIPRALIGDPVRIRQILLNLGSNAVKFTEEGRVRVIVRRKSRNGALNLRFEIVDTGIGLTKEQQGKLFTAFSQAESSTSRKFGGTGLGLSICKRLCELMGGAIGVESEPGTGSTFWFELPFEFEDETAYEPDTEIAEASLLLVGYGDAERGVIEGYLRHAGVTDIAHCFDRLTDIPTLQDGLLNLNSGKPNSIFLNGKPGLHGLSSQLDALTANEITAQTPLVISAHHAAASTLQADSTNVRGAKMIATATAPLSVRRIWHLVAVALGKAELEAETEDHVDLTFVAPDIETARANNTVILIAEDNETNQIVIHRILSRFGLNFEIADDGVDALSFYQDRPFGLLLTDFHMPNMDGFELTANIREIEKKNGNVDAVRLPIVALTADALAETEQQCLDAGMDGYLRKPIEMAKLEAALRTHLPVAFELRVEERHVESQDQGSAVDDLSSVIEGFVTEIFDPNQLIDSFGAFDEAAIGAVMGLADELENRTAELTDVIMQGDAEQGSKLAHALKGSANSTGARRFGQVMSDIEELLKAGDTETAKLIAQMLGPTLDELMETLAPLQQFRN